MSPQNPVVRGTQYVIDQVVSPSEISTFSPEPKFGLDRHGHLMGSSGRKSLNQPHFGTSRCRWKEPSTASRADYSTTLSFTPVNRPRILLACQDSTQANILRCIRPPPPTVAYTRSRKLFLERYEHSQLRSRSRSFGNFFWRIKFRGFYRHTRERVGEMGVDRIHHVIFRNRVVSSCGNGNPNGFSQNRKSVERDY